MVSVAPTIVSRSLSRLLVTSSTILIGKRRRKKTLRSLSGFHFFPFQTAAHEFVPVHAALGANQGAAPASGPGDLSSGPPAVTDAPTIMASSGSVQG